MSLPLIHVKIAYVMPHNKF